jgi:hypothetical protein
VISLGTAVVESGMIWQKWIVFVFSLLLFIFFSFTQVCGWWRVYPTTNTVLLLQPCCGLWHLQFIPDRRLPPRGQHIKKQ